MFSQSSACSWSMQKWQIVWIWCSNDNVFCNIFCFELADKLCQSHKDILRKIVWRTVLTKLRSPWKSHFTFFFIPDLDREQQRLDAVSKAILRVFTPAMIYMNLSRWFVHSFGDSDECVIRQAYQSFKKSATAFDSPSGSPCKSGIMANDFIAIILALMVAFIFLVVWLNKTGPVAHIK